MEDRANRDEGESTSILIATARGLFSFSSLTPPLPLPAIFGPRPARRIAPSKLLVANLTSFH